MDPVSSLPALAALFTASMTIHFITKRVGTPSAQGRFASIDGLRGYLAFFVFLHHSAIWYFWLRTDQWKVPPSNLYTHFGQSSVALFFMITAFLFFSKLIDGRKRGIDWEKLFISRFLRLVPLYLFVMLLLFLIVTLLSNSTLNEPFLKLIKGVIRWVGFTILGAPDLNGISRTSTIVAGVTWSLPYEWFFYFLLPLFALALGLKPSLPYLILSLVCIASLPIWPLQIQHLLPFLGGIASSFLVRINAFRQFSVKGIASLLVFACISIAVAIFPSAYETLPLLLLSLAFTLIAAGNTLFGVLISPISRSLGELAYSIYLLHGIILFVVFTFIVGTTNAKNLSPLMHWMLIIGLSPILISISFLTFRFIERPCMQSTNTVTNYLRSR